MSTAHRLRMEELRSARFLADHLANEIDSAFRSLVTAQQLVKRLNTVVLDPAGINYRRPDHEGEMRTALERLERLGWVDPWSIDDASSAAMTVSDILDFVSEEEQTVA